MSVSKIAIMGFVGCGNLGDEAILAGTLGALQDLGADEPVVFSWNPAETAAQHGVQVLPVLPGWQGLKEFRSHLQKGDLFLLGGGSLLQDGQSRVIPFWLGRALAAKLAGCKVVYHAQGVGPVRTFIGRLLVNLIVPFTAHLVTLRDADSFRLIPSSSRPHLVADPALLLPPLAQEKIPGRVVVAVRHVPGMEDQEKDLAACLAHFAKRNELNLMFVPMHYPDDCEISSRLAKLSGGEHVSGRLSLPDLRQLLASAQLVVAMRLHAAVLAAGLLTPVVGLSYDPKVQSFMTQIGLGDSLCPWEGKFSYQKFLDILDHEYHSRSSQRERLSERVPPLRQRAQEAVTLALKVWQRRHDRA
jgi:polysaccharide pyruvyl transferase CsaB